MKNKFDDISRVLWSYWKSNPKLLESTNINRKNNKREANIVVKDTVPHKFISVCVTRKAFRDEYYI